jgi:uncharacterized peroxidase-related enzyme
VSRIKPLDVDELPERLRVAADRAEALMGFVPNDSLVMARNPQLLEAFGALVGAVYKPGKVDSGLKRLVGLISSSAAGCQYCMGHTAHTSRNQGISEEKLAAVWEFEQSSLFDEAERAALRVALLAGQTPNSVTDQAFTELARHYDEEAQLEIVAVIAMFGFLNRWNSTLATELESVPQAALHSSRRQTD